MDVPEQNQESKQATDEQKYLDKVRLALEPEKELSQIENRFFSMASHVFRTPLSTILAAAQVLESNDREWDDITKRSRNLHRIQSAAKHMVQLLDDILTINRAETGSLEFTPQQIDLESFCHHLMEEMRASASDRAIVLDCHTEIASVCLDKELLRSIMSNLISNAIKYSHRGSTIHIRLNLRANNLYLEIKDNGIGIPPEDLERLYQPFHRGKNVGKIPGAGLGLLVVKKCVDLHGGNINITSKGGEGTSCYVTLPLSP
ncbi:sensor histidine kinase [Pseudanabaena sp. PCC 6802]|uniref:sensor histidine kinase n=1 Tax=Pseudanabaena sp. PCC 6802 TaxID=118173 RepID=UPI00034B1F33|nr:HAMP domain-containing sensor histidine kinase [Pseudanabaena sp. PCC 6802]